MSWLTAFIALLRAWLGIRAEIAQKQAEHVGEVVQTNTDLRADNKLLKAQEQALEKKEDFRDALKHHDI